MFFKRRIFNKEYKNRSFYLLILKNRKRRNLDVRKIHPITNTTFKTYCFGSLRISPLEYEDVGCLLNNFSYKIFQELVPAFKGIKDDIVKKPITIKLGSIEVSTFRLTVSIHFISKLFCAILYYGLLYFTKQVVPIKAFHLLYNLS